MREADVALGEPSFGPHYAVGAQMLEDPWIGAAVATMAARLPQEEPEEPAMPKRKRKSKKETEQ